MQKLISAVMVFVLVVSTPAESLGSLPRKSPEFTISEPGGKTTMLSSFKRKVVVIEFLFLGSEHCMRVAMTMNRLYSELGSQGFQPVGIAFGPNADAANTYWASQSLRLKFPVGYTNNENVDSYLGRGKDEEGVNIPQVVVIDRAGMIRAQSGHRPGDPKLENEDSLRTLLEDLLKESPPADGPAKAPPAPSHKSGR
jgi:peroxiredoxin